METDQRSSHKQMTCTIQYISFPTQVFFNHDQLTGVRLNVEHTITINSHHIEQSLAPCKLHHAAITMAPIIMMTITTQLINIYLTLVSIPKKKESLIPRLISIF